MCSIPKAKFQIEEDGDGLTYKFEDVDGGWPRWWWSLGYGDGGDCQADGVPVENGADEPLGCMCDFKGSQEVCDS